MIGTATRTGELYINALLPGTQGDFVFIKLGIKNCRIAWFGIDMPSRGGCTEQIL
jgi:hypothetical protein